MERKNKKAISKISKIMIGLQLVIVVGTLVLIFVFGPKTDYPRNNAVIQGRIVDFETKHADIILIDDNPDFTSPKKVEINGEDIKILFEPGTYYWKVSGIFNSNIKRFTIPSEVGLELEDSTLENVGNVKLDISKYDETGFSGLTILDVNVKYPVEGNGEIIYRGEENEK